MNGEIKPWWQSKAVLGGLGVVAVSVSGLFGAAVNADDVTEVLGHADKIATGIFGLIAIYGRITARGRIG